MTLKDKAKTYNFWISLVSAVILIVRIVGNKFNIFIDTTLIMDITTGLCSIFVVLGILSAPKQIQKEVNTTTDVNNLNNQIETKISSFLEQNKTDDLCEEKNNSIQSEVTNNVVLENQKIQEQENYVDFEEQIINNVEILESSAADKKEETSNVANFFNKTLIDVIEHIKCEIQKVNNVIDEYSSKNN